MCDCSKRILQPVTHDVKVFETVVSPYSAGALAVNDSIFGAIEIPCFFRDAGTPTELLGYELIERCNSGGTLLKLAVKFVLFGYNGFVVAAGDEYVEDNTNELANPLLAIDKMSGSEYEDLGAQVSQGTHSARPNTIIKNPKEFATNDALAKTSVWLHVLANDTGTYPASPDGYSARIRVRYKRYDNC